MKIHNLKVYQEKFFAIIFAVMLVFFVGIMWGYKYILPEYFPNDLNKQTFEFIFFGIMVAFIMVFNMGRYFFVGLLNNTMVMVNSSGIVFEKKGKRVSISRDQIKEISYKAVPRNVKMMVNNSRRGPFMAIATTKGVFALRGSREPLDDLFKDLDENGLVSEVSKSRVDEIQVIIDESKKINKFAIKVAPIILLFILMFIGVIVFTVYTFSK